MQFETESHLVLSVALAERMLEGSPVATYVGLWLSLEGFLNSVVSDRICCKNTLYLRMNKIKVWIYSDSFGVIKNDA